MHGFLQCFNIVVVWLLLHILNIFLTLLLLLPQSGHNIEKVREKMRELVKQIIHAYSAAKTFPYILEGLRSRNNRTRIECVDLAGFLIDNHGAEVTIECYLIFFVVSLIFLCKVLCFLPFFSADCWTVEILADCCKFNSGTRWWTSESCFKYSGYWL